MNAGCEQTRADSATGSGRGHEPLGTARGNSPLCCSERYLLRHPRSARCTPVAQSAKVRGQLRALSPGASFPACPPLLPQTTVTGARLPLLAAFLLLACGSDPASVTDSGAATLDSGVDGSTTIDVADVTDEADEDALPDTGPGSLGTCCEPECATRCDLDTQECCIDIGAGGAAECVAAEACDSGVAASCDGPEDCPGTVCCIQGTFSFGGAGTDVSASCVDSCEYAFDLLSGSLRTVAYHGATDCGHGQSCCSESRAPASICLDGLAVGAIELAGGVCEGR